MWHVIHTWIEFLINISLYVWHVIHTWIEFDTKDILKCWVWRGWARSLVPNMPSQIRQDRQHREHSDGPWLAKSGMVPELILALSLVQTLLRQTFSQHFHPHSWNINLHAWRSSKDSTRSDFSFWSGCAMAHYISEVSELPPSDIYPPPPPQTVTHIPLQLSPCLSAHGHSSSI